MKKSALLFLFALLLVSCGRLEPFTVPQVNLSSGELAMKILTDAGAISALATSPDGRYLLTVDNGGTYTASDFGVIRMWDLVEGRQVFKATNTLKLASAVAFSPDGKYVVTGGQTRPFLGRGNVKKEQEQDQYALNVWDASKGTIVWKFPGFRGPSLQVYDVKFSRDGRYFAATSLNELYVFDTSIWKAVRKFSVKGCMAADFSPDGKKIIFGDSNGLLHFREIATSREIWRVRGHTTCLGWAPNSIAFSPDGKSVLTSSRCDSTVRVWDAASGRQVREFAGFAEFRGVLIGGSGVNGTVLSPDGRQVLVLAKPLQSLDVDTGRELADLTHAVKWEATYTGRELSGAYMPDGKRLLVSLSESAVRMYDARTGAEMAMFVGFTDGEWLVITKEGYYNSSEKGAQYLSVMMGQNSYGVDRFYDVFYRPDIVAVKLRGEDVSGLATVSMTDAIKNPPPDVELTYKSDPGQAAVKACYQVRSAGGGIGEVRLFHNGKLVQSDGYYREVAKSSLEKAQLASLDSKYIYEDMRGVSIRDKADPVRTSIKSKGETFEDCSEINPVAGENELSIAAFNSSNTVQSAIKSVRFNSTIKAEDPHLYILSVGVDHYRDASINLKYAAKDARELEEKIRAQSATIYKPQNIHYVRLTDAEATKANIIGQIGQLSRLIKPGDSFIMFIAGHGVLLQNQYYVLTHDFSGRVDDANVISSNEIVEMSKRIKSLSQLFIFDTCHAGGVDYIISGLYDARMSVLAKKMGLHIYASAGDKQAAMDGYSGNGLFTHTLLDGLNNNRGADRNRDGKVTVVGLGDYAKEKTAGISRRIGHAQVPLIINFGKDYPIYQLR